VGGPGLPQPRREPERIQRQERHHRGPEGGSDGGSTKETHPVPPSGECNGATCVAKRRVQKGRDRSPTLRPPPDPLPTKPATQSMVRFTLTCHEAICRKNPVTPGGLQVGRMCIASPGWLGPSARHSLLPMSGQLTHELVRMTSRWVARVIAVARPRVSGRSCTGEGGGPCWIRGVFLGSCAHRH
jgi:hypothetical protein